MARTPSEQKIPALSLRGRGLFFLSLFILITQIFHISSPVRDAASLQWVPGFKMAFPFWHLFFTPFSSLADYLTLLSEHQHIVLITWVVVLSFVLGGLKRGMGLILAFLGFFAWAALIPRPMSRLVSSDPNTLLLDFHSHTLLSHDGRKSFSPEDNMQWHINQGYHAAFITDHNQVGSSEHATALSEKNWQKTGYRSLRGEEISLWKTHLVILGNHERIDNVPFDSDPKKVGAFIAAMHAKGIPVIASLPEYWWYHWGKGLNALIKEGIDGFELVNSAPKALDFPVAKRLEIVELCKKNNLIVTGISDTHGYGSATAVWNAMRIPGWQGMSPGALELAVLYSLDKERFNAVTVLERYRFIHRNVFELILSPIGHAVAFGRSLTPWQALAWILWILTATTISPWIRRRGSVE